MLEDSIINVAGVRIRLRSDNKLDKVPIYNIFKGFLINSNDDVDLPIDLKLIPKTKVPQNSNIIDINELVNKKIYSYNQKFPFTALPDEKEIIENFKYYIYDNELIESLKVDIDDLILYPFDKDNFFLFDILNNKAYLCYKTLSILELQNSVGIIISSTITNMSGCFFHGAGISRFNKGFLFLGLSGTGKSTISKSYKKGLLSDDGVIIKKVNNKYFIFPTPFNQTILKQKIPLDFYNKCIELNKIFILVKDKKNFLEMVEPSHVLMFMLQNYIHFFRYLRDIEVKKIFYFCESICKNIFVYKLHFKKQISFWNLLK